MWRPLINIINNKYLDTPECSQPWGTQAQKYFCNQQGSYAGGGGSLCAEFQPDSTRPGLGKIEKERQRELLTAPYDAAEETTLSRHTHTYHGIPCSPALLGLGSFPLCVPPFPSPVPDFIAAVSFRFLSNVWLNDGIDGWITRKR